MKIREKGNDLQPEALQALHQQLRARRKKGENGAAAEEHGAEAADTVELGLARAIQNQLDPEKILSERRQRVEELKQLIAAGKYKPSGEAVARAVAEEITMEIMTAPPEEEAE